MRLSRDADLAVYEAQVFGGVHLKWQAVCGGTGGIAAGTQFASSGVDFAACGIEAGDVLWLESADGAIAGAYEIAGVIDAGHLTVSVLRGEAGQAPVPVGTASGLTWRIVRYAAQCHEAARQISRRLGLRPGYAEGKYGLEDVTDIGALREAAVFGTLALIFEAAQNGAAGQAFLKEKAAHYRQRFDEEMAGVRVGVDTNRDGRADQVIQGGQGRFGRD